MRNPLLTSKNFPFWFFIFCVKISHSSSFYSLSLLSPPFLRPSCASLATLQSLSFSFWLGTFSLPTMFHVPAESSPLPHLSSIRFSLPLLTFYPFFFLFGLVFSSVLCLSSYSLWQTWVFWDSRQREMSGELPKRNFFFFFLISNQFCVFFLGTMVDICLVSYSVSGSGFLTTVCYCFFFWSVGVAMTIFFLFYCVGGGGDFNLINVGFAFAFKGNRRPWRWWWDNK